jgi:hypothetical protein
MTTATDSTQRAMLTIDIVEVFVLMGLLRDSSKKEFGM